MIDSLPLPPEELEQELELSEEDEIELKTNEWEYFRISGDNIAIINDCRTIKKFRKGIHTAYGKYIIKSNTDDIYKWRFKIEKAGNGILSIGIASKIMLYLNEPYYQYDEFENYSYNIFNGYSITQNIFQQYALSSKTGDIVDMELDMDECTLSYYINNEFQGCAFDEIIKDNHTKYQMAVSLQENYDEITLIDFQIIKQ